MAESRTTNNMNEIRELLERQQYTVDPKAVAGAVLERLLAARATPSARPSD